LWQTVKGQPATAGVIGAGIIGSWTALHLAEAGVATTLIEQFPLPHGRGSSHGASRAFRLLGDDTLDRLDYSQDRWRELEEATGETLFLKTGLLNFGPPGDPDLEKHMAVLEQGGRPCEWLDSDAITARFPMLRYPDEWGAAWDPSGGILFADRCLNAVQSRFRALGGRIVTARVKSVESTVDAGARIRLRSNTTGKTKTLGFDRAVVCAGPWTARLLPQLAELLHSLLIPVTYWRDPSGSHGISNGFPILFNARLTGVYSLPSCEYHGLVKVLFHGGPETDPDTRDLPTLKPYIEKISRYIQEHLPLLDHRQPAILEPCMYTMTPDSEPILDRLAHNLVIGCGFSGSGFKHSPATGWLLAALALGREEILPDGFQAKRYVLDRFQN
jgi:sarcosine oxidase/L-pipecolate oxidase